METSSPDLRTIAVLAVQAFFLILQIAGAALLWRQRQASSGRIDAIHDLESRGQAFEQYRLMLADTRAAHQDLQHRYDALNGQYLDSVHNLGQVQAEIARLKAELKATNADLMELRARSLNNLCRSCGNHDAEARENE